MPFVNNTEYYSFLKDKKVAVVGPAKSIEGTRQGALIDSYDVVVRIKSVHVPPELETDLGTKVDILYTDDESSNDIFPEDKVEKSGDKWVIRNKNEQIRNKNIYAALENKKSDLKYICSAYPRGEWFFNRFESALQTFSENYNVRIINDQPYFEIKRQTNRPNAGFCAIIDLLTAPISELYVTGIDFYRSLYRGNYLNSGYTPETIKKWERTNDGVDPKTGKKDRHDPDAQFKYFKYNMYLKDKRIKVDKFLNKVLNNPIYEKFENNHG